ncbi:MAG: tRNA 2-thiouridine(34) synthase MnmA [Lentisphaerae bacterium]|nr:tRNA 2-thiouridine(34) synthase MnmA [Lentisphaerota bacterium]
MENSVTDTGRIAVALSGGVDSAVAAALLQEAGREVFAVTAVLDGGAAAGGAGDGVAVARAVAARLGMAHEVVDLRERFAAGVIAPCRAAYRGGRTPNPCVWCNQRIKFGALLEAARERGASRLATGHYARIACGTGGRLRLLRGADAEKDQSYFLAMLTPGQLEAALFPVGGGSKADVRAAARRLKLPCRASRSSRDLCFAWTPEREAPGEIVDTAGRVLGRHRGIQRYTVGQRRGFGVGAGGRRYVVALDPARNRVVLGTREEASRTHLRVEGIRWLRPPGAGRMAVSVQLRYAQAPVPADVAVEGTAAAVTLAAPQFAVTPGQLAVFYEADEVLGGGWIA